MSAWIVSREHIDRIVSTALDWNRDLRPEEATPLGRALWVENLKSVAHRYPYDTSGTRPGPVGLQDAEIRAYRFTSEVPPLTPNEMLKALHCLEYQSCEHPGWETSRAHKLVITLGAEAERRGASERSAEYDRAPWAWG